MAIIDFLSNALLMFGGSAGYGKGDQKKVQFFIDCSLIVRNYPIVSAFLLMVGLFFGGFAGFVLGQIAAYLLHI